MTLNPGFWLLLASVAHAQTPSKPADKPAYFDEPQFIVAGVTDNTYRGGHGADTALRSSEELAKATASLTENRTLTAIEAERSGEAVRAAKEYQQAAERDPSEANLFDWGSELLKHRAAEAAEKVFRSGRARYPRSKRMLLGLAASCYARGEYDQAAEAFFRAADLNPSDAEPYLFLGLARSLMIVRSDGYLERMARFAKMQPRNALAQYYWAGALINRQAGQEAIPLLRQAIQLDPKLGIAYLQLGILYLEAGQTRAAAENLTKAIEVNPELEEAHYRLAEVYRKQGAAESARREIALYDELVKKSSAELEKERNGVQQFVLSEPPGNH
jgi:tetratricopeptide (TPR) repeat protein